MEKVFQMVFNMPVGGDAKRHRILVFYKLCLQLLNICKPPVWSVCSHICKLQSLMCCPMRLLRFNWVHSSACICILYFSLTKPNHDSFLIGIPLQGPTESQLLALIREHRIPHSFNHVIERSAPGNFTPTLALPIVSGFWIEHFLLKLDPQGANH